MRTWLRHAALLLGVTTVVGCGHSAGPQPPADGVLTVTVAPAPLAVSGLQLSSARIQVEGLTVFGDVATDSRSMVSEFHLDLLSPVGPTFTLDMLPQGVYSRVRFIVDNVEAEGTWRGVPLHVHLDSEDSLIVDLRWTAGVEVAPGHDAALNISLDANSWFAGQLLDSAQQSGGEIVIDSQSNLVIGAQLAARIPSSFSLHDAPVR